MANPVDILLDENFDLAVENGDFKTGDATEQHQQLLLLSNKGNWKQSPYVGVGLQDFILEDGDGYVLQQEIQKQFTLDGMIIKTLDVVDLENIKLKAEYK